MSSTDRLCSLSSHEAEKSAENNCIILTMPNLRENIALILERSSEILEHCIRKSQHSSYGKYFT
jgi:hypothetical protein